MTITGRAVETAVSSRAERKSARQIERKIIQKRKPLLVVVARGRGGASEEVMSVFSLRLSAVDMVAGEEEGGAREGVGEEGV